MSTLNPSSYTNKRCICLGYFVWLERGKTWDFVSGICMAPVVFLAHDYISALRMHVSGRRKDYMYVLL